MEIDRRAVMMGTTAALGAAAVPATEIGAASSPVTITGALRYQDLPIYIRSMMARDWLGWPIDAEFRSYSGNRPKDIVASVAEWVETAFDTGLGEGYYFYREPGARQAVQITDAMHAQAGPQLSRAISGAEASGYFYRAAK